MSRSARRGRLTWRPGWARLPDPRPPPRSGGSGSGFFYFGGEVPGEPGGPLTRRVPGDPEQVHPSRLEFDDERDAQAAERDRAVEVEEIGGKQRACVSAREDAPGSVMPDGGGMR